MIINGGVEILFSGEVWRDYKWEKENGWNYLNNKYGFLTRK